MLVAQVGGYENQPVECYCCGGVYPRCELDAVQEIPGYRWPRYCRSCAEEIRAAHARACLLCGRPYMARLASDPASLCPTCCNPYRLRELARVRYHVARAWTLALPATLTLAQWLAAIEHFGWLCAYCQQEPYSDLDHFTPMAAGGGTTAANCVPACAHCNNAKAATDPDAGAPASLAGEALVRVRAYLRGQTGVTNRR